MKKILCNSIFNGEISLRLMDIAKFCPLIEPANRDFVVPIS